jgi:pimeloyl-ACP methyl ester carboxylesterase
MTRTVSTMLAGAGGAAIEVLVDQSDSRDAPTIVLLPSSQRDSRDFDDLAQLLVGHGFHVLRPQPRGMGRSAPPSAGMTLHVLADDVARTIDAWGHGPAIVAGHAYGHYVARVTDLDHPGVVRGVVVLASAARTFPPDLVAALDMAADPTRPVAERLACLKRAFFAPKSDAGAWLDGWHPHLRDIYRQAGATPSKDRWWPVTHAPILDLQGEEDPWRPSSTRGELKDCLGDKVTVQVIAGASHALIPEQPQAVADAIAAWARGLPTTSRPPSA